MRIPNERIDFIFHKPGPTCDINVVLSELVLQKNPVSDHYGIIASFASTKSQCNKDVK